MTRERFRGAGLMTMAALTPSLAITNGGPTDRGAARPAGDLTTY